MAHDSHATCFTGPKGTIQRSEQSLQHHDLWKDDSISPERRPAPISRASPCPPPTHTHMRCGLWGPASTMYVVVGFVR